MFERFLFLTAENPSAPALVESGPGTVIDRAALAAMAGELAARLSDSGLRSGEIVAVRLPNSPEFVAAVLAASKLDLVLAPIDRDATESEVKAVLTHFGIRGLIYRPEPAAPAVITTRPVEAVPPLPAGARLLKMTSGSTGTPKGIVCSEANLAADRAQICATMGIAPEDVQFGAIPFSHSYGFSNLVTPLIQQGTAVVVSNDYLPLSILALANRHRCTVAPLIPMVFEHLASLPKEDGSFTTVRTFISAGAPLMPSTSRRFRERFGVPIHSFYGCSECGGITYDREGGAAERGTVGAALEGVDLSIGPGQRLEIRSDAVALGYLLDSATFQPFDGSRFLSDDLVELRDGEITLTGRASELINTAGRKVNPREVEQVLLQMEGVAQAKVWGEPAGARGEVVAAAIVGHPGLTREQVREFCRARLSPHKVPRIVKLIESIPVDERGKVRRAALAAL